MLFGELLYQHPISEVNFALLTKQTYSNFKLNNIFLNAKIMVDGYIHIPELIQDSWMQKLELCHVNSDQNHSPGPVPRDRCY